MYHQNIVTDYFLTKDTKRLLFGVFLFVFFKHLDYFFLPLFFDKVLYDLYVHGSFDEFRFQCRLQLVERVDLVFVQDKLDFIVADFERILSLDGIEVLIDLS